MKKNPNILIVDDQPDNIRTLAAMLTAEGYKVRKALNGETALEAIRALSPDLILLDVMMPKMDGYEVCCALKASAATREIPVIFLSALSESSDKAQALAAGGSDYITKPFQAEDVLQRVSYHLTIQCQRRKLIEQQRLQYEERQRAEIAKQQANQEQLLHEINEGIRQGLQLNDILSIGVEGIRRLLKVDQVLLLRFYPDRTGRVVAESVNAASFSLLGRIFDTLSWKQYWHELFRQGQNDIDADIYGSDLKLNYAELLSIFQIQVSLSTPILPLDPPWGIIVGHHRFNPRAWMEWEVDSLQQSIEQLAIAIQRSRL